jgi:hypothetical protein
MLYLLTIYAYCIYPALSKSPKQLPNCLKRARTIVVLIAFIGIFYDVGGYAVTIFYRNSS